MITKTKDRILPQTSRLRFFAIFTAPMLLIGVLLLAFFTYRMDSVVETWSVKRARGIASVLMTSIAPGLDFGDASGVHEILQRLGAAHEFIYASVYQSDHTLLAAYKPELRPNLELKVEGQPVWTRQDDQLHLATPLEARAGTSGVLYIGFSLADLKQDQHTNLIIITAAAISVLLIGIGFSLLGSSFVRSRHAAEQTLDETLTTLQELAQAAREVVKGNLSMEIRTEGDLSDAFREMLQMLRLMSEQAKQIAEGNLGAEVKGRGDLADAYRNMVDSLREMVESLHQTAIKISSTGEQIVATSKQQETGATSQFTSVESTQKTMESLLESARQIAKSAQGVLRDAELTRSNHQVLAERIGQLAAHTNRIAEVLEIIEDISYKSDLLALNASLEGTRAGEAGRGFSLVATQMRRLSENVMGYVEDIKTLTKDINQTSAATVEAIEEGMRLAASTTDSARQISLVTQQQQSGTEQVFQAMNEISLIARQTVEGSKQSTFASQELTHLAENLKRRVEGFKS